MNSSEVRDKLTDILVDKFEFQEKSLDFSKPQTSTGLSIGLSAPQMYELLMCIENEFHLYFQPRDFESMSFRSLHGVEAAVLSKLSNTT